MEGSIRLILIKQRKMRRKLSNLEIAKFLVPNGCHLFFLLVHLYTDIHTNEAICEVTPALINSSWKKVIVSRCQDLAFFKHYQMIMRKTVCE